MDETTLKFDIPSSEDFVFVYNLSIIEHPHGGLMCSFVSKDIESKIYLTHFNSKQKKWMKPWIIHHTNNKAEITHTIFMDLKGNLILMYEIENKIHKKGSHDYGKNWSNSIIVYDEDRHWKFNNQPIFMQDGKIVLPIFDEIHSRSLSLNSNDDGKTWYPSTYIETSETDQDLEDLEGDSIKITKNYNDYKPYFPIFIHQSEIIIGAFLQTKNSEFIQYTESEIGEIWEETVSTSLTSSINPISGIRLRDKLGNYTPKIFILFLILNKGKSKLKRAISEDNGKNWDKIKVLITNNDEKMDNPSIIQTSDLKIHVVFTINSTSISHLEFNIVAENRNFTKKSY
ncbi:MAG: hypothetical protein GY870_04485 [archaeon]|nr:hypothetical protein [archaeon]